MNILIPMAGLGNRFKIAGYSKSKPMIRIGEKTMIQHAIDSLGINGKYIFIVNNKAEEYNGLRKILNTIVNNPIIIEIDYLTEGPASSCLLAETFIDSDEKLLIANCDQIMEWDKNKFNNFLQETNLDGVVVTYNVITEKNSYVKLNDNGIATEFAEKKIISDKSLNGIHFWQKGSDFIRSTKNMIKKNIRVNNEFYIAPTYNELILENKKIGIYEIENDEHWAVGTPEDLLKYLKHANLQTK
jgi:NDP-sugar pyrophosphorylase family protein